jgi:hypothetical protein
VAPSPGAYRVSPWLLIVLVATLVVLATALVVTLEQGSSATSARCCGTPRRGPSSQPDRPLRLTSGYDAITACPRGSCAR